MDKNSRKPKFSTEQEYDQRLIEVARVTRVMAGGKRMRFRAALVIGDRKGVVGFGLAKGVDVTLAIQKAFNQAKKNLIKVAIQKGTIAHKADCKFGAAYIIIKPAKVGEGLKAGGATRSVLELAGIQDITAKSLGSNNKVNVIRATFEALMQVKGTHKVSPAAAAKKDTREGGPRGDKRGPAGRRPAGGQKKGGPVKQAMKPAMLPTKPTQETK